MHNGRNTILVALLIMAALFLAAGAFLVLSASPASAKKPPKPPPEPPEPAYDITELPETPWAINDAGDALGSTGIVALRSQPVMIQLEGLPGAGAVGPADLSNEDADGVFQVVGTCCVVQDEVYAAVWAEVDATTGDVVSGPMALDPTGQYPWTFASAVNDLGEIAGHCMGGFMWRSDGMGGFQVVELPPPIVEGVAVYAEPVDINNLGQVLGTAELWVPNLHIHYPVLWQIDDATTGEYLEPIDLGTLSPGVNSYAVAMNDLGQVVGYSNVGGGAFQAWLVDPRDMDGDGALEWFWDADGDGINDLMVALNPGGGATQPYGINNAGQVVGTYRKGKQSQGGTDGFIWQDGVMTLLRELVPPEYSEWYLPAYCINDQGQIGGSGRSGGKWGGVGMAYLLTPRP